MGVYKDVLISETSRNEMTLLRDAIMRVHDCSALFTMMYVVDVFGIRLVSSVYQS